MGFTVDKKRTSRRQGRLGNKYKSLLLYWENLEETSISGLRAKDRSSSSVTLFLFSVGAWYNLTEHVSNQNSRYIAFISRNREMKSENVVINAKAYNVILRSVIPVVLVSITKNFVYYTYSQTQLYFTY